jgi:energy-coupling factor transport system ATP-binding protein
MIRLENVSFTYPSQNKPVFSGLNLEIPVLSSVVVAGPDGSGKTTLAKLIKGLLQPDSGSITGEGDLRLGVAYLGGDPSDCLIGISVEEDVAFGLENLGLSCSEMRVRLTRALEWTGLSGMEKRLIHTLSGGEQQKVALAGLLAMGSSILILDEALNMCDRATRLSLRSLVHSIRRGAALTVIEVTNNLEDALGAERIIFLSDGAVAFDGTPGDFLASVDGRRWVEMAGGLAALAGALFQQGVLPMADPQKIGDFL